MKCLPYLFYLSVLSFDSVLGTLEYRENLLTKSLRCLHSKKGGRGGGRKEGRESVKMPILMVFFYKKQRKYSLSFRQYFNLVT